ncbi:peptidyl-prolyl cis-trans isomerase cyp15 [Violaceomyces palustris]|uniref:Peptidyl-prolyl cis-trans isomerase cyp15 n=1 Tax=Violaceomyces palustris TaxID=1673888 RepID=A0ACD0P4B9_9BASI|nr:peptidyl-prolyl cis-trans isomerase cyp15 [Violaceomyces palustris]
MLDAPSDHKGLSGKKRSRSKEDDQESSPDPGPQPNQNQKADSMQVQSHIASKDGQVQGEDGHDHQNGGDDDDDDDDDDEDDEDYGPMPAPSEDPTSAGSNKRKKRKTLPHEQVYLDHLPSSDRYYKSLMHRDTINFVTVTRTNFVITTSVDGHVKFWKKLDEGIEFVKHYRAHLSPIVGVSSSADGAFFATIANDGTAKVFDVINFDMINMFKLGYTPRACCWIHKRGRADTILAISEEGSKAIRLYDGRGDGEPVSTIETVHKQPCHLITYNETYDCVVSADVGGMIEYWKPTEPYQLPKGVFEYKSSTDLFEFKKSKATPNSINFSPDNTHFVTTSTSDRQVRIFHFASGKLKKKYDESLRAVQEMQQAGTTIYKLDDMEFGRRLAVERELDNSVKDGPGDATTNAMGAGTGNAVFDESGNFLIYPTMLGIKIVNTVTNRVCKLLGKDETTRFLNVSIYQGAPTKKATSIALAASDNPLLAKKGTIDPTLFCTAFKRSRFYLFTRSEPESDPNSKGGAERDVFNERPTREEQTIASTQPTGVGKARNSNLASAVIIHTTKGDIHLRLFPDLVPKTVENFVGLSRKKYYDDVIFHRVIKKFMLQTGDPLGDGTGGESIWGKEFEDEFRKELKHDRPYTVSMANAGPNTNGSQFFITTVPTPWLDGKHTVFGRATAGMDVIHSIENCKVDKNDKPREDIKIINITVQ